MSPSTQPILYFEGIDLSARTGEQLLQMAAALTEEALRQEQHAKDHAKAARALAHDPGKLVMALQELKLALALYPSTIFVRNVKQIVCSIVENHIKNMLEKQNYAVALILARAFKENVPDYPNIAAWEKNIAHAKREREYLGGVLREYDKATTSHEKITLAKQAQKHIDSMLFFLPNHAPVLAIGTALECDMLRIQLEQALTAYELEKAEALLVQIASKETSHPETKRLTETLALAKERRSIYLLVTLYAAGAVKIIEMPHDSPPIEIGTHAFFNLELVGF